jgi:myosin-crossreactive antigen
MMPYITSQFMPHKISDRPRIVPDGCTNLAFIGQYVEVPGDAVFTVEMYLGRDRSIASKRSVLHPGYPQEAVTDHLV